MQLNQQFPIDSPVSYDVAQSIFQDEKFNSPSYDKIGLLNEDEFNTGGFLWFESVEELQFFIRNVWPVLLKQEDIGQESFQKWCEALDQDLNDPALIQHALSFVNDYWNGDIFLSWSGTLKELESGKGNIPEKTRQMFHESEAPIPEAKLKEFHEFIAAGFA